jgi:hypothetical protein
MGINYHAYDDKCNTPRSPCYRDEAVGWKRKTACLNYQVEWKDLSLLSVEEQYDICFV